MKNNFLIKQYLSDKKMKIRHNYLSEQFNNSKEIFKSINKTVKFNDFTLGRYVDLFEKQFCKYQKVKYAVGVGSGTDAIFLSLKALGIKHGDEIITPTYSFYATAGAIATAGAKPIFVDIKDDLNIDDDQIEKKITKKTKAIVPVHWSGRICNMKKILKLAKKYNLHVVEDACHAILSHDDKKKYAGNFGITGCFSMHPLKNLNVWGDGGIIGTNNKKIYEKLKLLRNHGLINRNNCKMYGYNSRLDTIQAAVALKMIKKINFITDSRIKNANYLNEKLKSIKEIKLIKEKKKYKYYKGQFKNAEKLSKKVISIPVHEFVSKKQLDFMINKIQKFYN